VQYSRVSCEADRHQLEDFRHEFRSIAAALRAGLSLADAKKQFGL
jgi:hypothetical protein